MQVSDEVLLGLKEGDIMEAGVLLPGLDRTERVAWQLLENAEDPKDASRRRLTFHAFYHDAFLFPATVSIGPDGQKWSR